MRTPDRPEGSTIEVDAQALDRIAATLRDLVGELQAPTGGLAGALADTPVRAALRDAENDWTERRARLKRSLEWAADSAQCASAAYRETDQAIRTAATPR